jgi:predicted RNA-binding protein with RPS1 domain
MAVETGTIAQGTVVRLLNYGVLVRLEDGTQGLVHISEIDNNYVRDVADYFQVNDPVTVKVLALGDRGRVELSVKQALGEGQTLTPRANTEGEAPRESRPAPDPSVRRESRASFEEKMGDFMRSSSERLGDLKRNIENKRGGKKTR